MTIDTTITAPTDDQIDRSILDALAESDAELVPWAALRLRLPGGIGRKADALTRLWLAGRVYLIKVRGCNYVGLGDEHDLQMAAKAKAEGRVLELRCL